jgi:hypothetical protein
MSKDGDWVLREDPETMEHVLRVLASRGSRYRFCAPLDVRWLAGGWSCHFEHREAGLRLRTDFVTRPPRLSPEELARLWADAEADGSEVVGLEPLAAIKLTNREKDYAVVAELSRRMSDRRSQLRFSRSARDLLRLAAEHPDAVADVLPLRPLLGQISEGREALEEALDRERRALIRANEQRLTRYRDAAREWESAWPTVAREIEGLPLEEAHRIVVARADGVLPFEPSTQEAP